MYQTIITMIANREDFSWQTLVVSLICIAVLFVVKEVLQPMYTKLKLPYGLNRIPLPIELVVVRSKL